ncbi:MAG: Ig domain-containing protein, partial [Defluviitaleaceae bacterium]|nr:Ig domain-containing protein [Defluviitaleaceae bacterium]
MRKSKRFFARFAAWVLAVILAAGVMPMYLSARPSVPPSVPRGRISGDLFTASGQTRTLQVTIPIERLIGTGSGHMYNITIATDYASGSIVHPQFDYITSAGGVSSDATVRIDATISGAERMDLRIQYSPDDISGFTSIPSNATGYFTFEIDVMSYDGDEWVDSWLLIWVGGALASGYGNLLISQSLAIPCAECNTRPCICNDSSNGNCPDCDAYPCICEPSAVAITTTALPNGVVSQAYSANIFATGVSPITWAVSGGSLPPGLNLSVSDTHEGSVTVSGTPTQVGTFPFTLTATSANGTTDSREFSITISDGALLRFTFSSVPPFMSVPFENPFHFAINAQLAAREHSAGSTPNFYSVRYEWLRNGVVWWGAGGSGVIPASRFAQGYSVAINLFLPGGLSHHDRGGVWQLRLTALNANGGSVFTDVSGSMFLTVHAQTWHEPWHPYVPEPTPPPRVSPPRAPVTP